jgi:hypothetical protein
MNDLDQRIQSALRSGSAAADPGADPNLAEEIIGTFRGRNRLLMAFSFAYSLALFAVAIWAAVKFYHAATVVAQLQWGALALVCLLIVMFVKVWFWLEMHTNRVLREVKRVELLLVSRTVPRS